MKKKKLWCYKFKVRFFEFLRESDEIGLAEWLKILSNVEKERMEKFK